MSSVVPAQPGLRRRRSASASDPLKKVTVHLHASVSEAITRIVGSGAAASKGAFIEDAVIARLREMRREKVYLAYDAAASDAVFMEDMMSTAVDFDVALADGLDA